MRGVLLYSMKQRAEKQRDTLDFLSELLVKSFVNRDCLRGGLMKDDLKNQALFNWRKLFDMPESLISAEARYNKLLMMADHMERTGLISSYEWRKLVQQAGTSFASTAECMGGADRK